MPHCGLTPTQWNGQENQEKSKSHGLREEQFNNWNRVKYNINKIVVVVIVIIIWRRRRERSKTWKKQMMRNTIAHHLLTSAKPVLAAWLAPLLRNSPSLYTGHGVLWYGISLWTVGVTGAVLAMLPPGFFCTSSMAEHKTLKIPWLRVSTTWQPKTSVCYQHYTGSKTQPCTSYWEKMNSIAAETRTRWHELACVSYLCKAVCTS